jgi:hypothetical protein
MPDKNTNSFEEFLALLDNNRNEYGIAHPAVLRTCKCRQNRLIDLTPNTPFDSLIECSSIMRDQVHTITGPSYVLGILFLSFDFVGEGKP